MASEDGKIRIMDFHKLMSRTRRFNERCRQRLDERKKHRRMKRLGEKKDEKQKQRVEKKAFQEKKRKPRQTEKDLQEHEEHQFKLKAAEALFRQMQSSPKILMQFLLLKGY